LESGVVQFVLTIYSELLGVANIDDFVLVRGASGHGSLRPSASNVGAANEDISRLLKFPAFVACGNFARLFDFSA